MGEDTYNPLQGLFTLLGKKIDADSAAKQAAAAWRLQDQLYGVDEYGRVYRRGAPSAAVGPGALTSSPLFPIGVGILAIALVVWALKS